MKYRSLILLVLIVVCYSVVSRAEEPQMAGKTVLETRLDETIPMDYGLLYDADIPLEETLEVIQETDLYTKYRLTYVSVNDMVIPAWYIVPKGEGPFPVVLFMHGKGGKKEDVSPFLDDITKEGIAVFVADPQYHGERRRKGRSINGRHIFTMVRAIQQTVLDYRRGIDFLETRPEINKDAILYMGGSMGGIIGAIVCGEDTRIAACVLTVAGGPWTEMAKKNPLDEDAADMNEFRKENNMSWDDLQVFLDPADPINYVGHISPRPLLMINGKNDIIVPMRATRKLWDRAKEPKEIWWLDYSHLLPYDEILPKMLEWYRENVPAMNN